MSQSSHSATVDLSELAEDLARHFKMGFWPMVSPGSEGSPAPDPNVGKELAEGHPVFEMLEDASDAQDTGGPGLGTRAENLGCNLHPSSGATHQNAQSKSVCGWRFTNSLLAASPLLWL